MVLTCEVKRLKMNLNIPELNCQIANSNMIMTEFNADYVRKIALDEIEKVLSYKKYNPKRNEKLIQTISQNVVERLTVSGKSVFKFITHSLISPSTLGGYDMFSNNFWNECTDGLALIDYENSELRFCMAIWGVRA